MCKNHSNTNNNENDYNEEDIMEVLSSVFSNARWKRKDLLYNIFSLYIQRYEYLEILKKDKSAAGKSKLKKACKLFAYSQSEDDPRDKNAIKIYEDITNYLKNQPLEYFASLNYPSGDLVSLLYDIYDEVYTSRKKRFDKEQQCLSALNRKQR